MNDDTPNLRRSQAKLSKDVQTVLADAQELMRQAAGEAGQGYKDARQKLEASIEAARQQLLFLPAAAMEGAREAGRGADDFVRRHPWEAIGVGAGIGLLLGVVLARR